MDIKEKLTMGLLEASFILGKELNEKPFLSEAEQKFKNTLDEIAIFLTS